MRRFITLASLTILILAACSQSSSQVTITFCEDVTLDFEPINPGDRFSPGLIAALIESPDRFAADSLGYRLLDLGDGQHVVQQGVVAVQPEWRKVVVPVTLPREGSFALSVTTVSGDQIGRSEVSIVDGLQP
jgi:hypothetical protein